jgi:hypothetical protein
VIFSDFASYKTPLRVTPQTKTDGEGGISNLGKQVSLMTGRSARSRTRRATQSSYILLLLTVGLPLR